MSSVKIEKAHIEDASILTTIKKNVFDMEKEKWLSGHTGVVDYNIQPPGYDSVEMGKYMIRELDYFKILFEGAIVGGLILTVVGKRHGRVDRIFIDPSQQGKGIGSNVMRRMEYEYPHVRTWELETSSRQLNNHYFYEKMGYRKVFETDDEFCYEKEMNEEAVLDGELRGLCVHGDTLKREDLSELQVEHCNMEKTDFYGINGSHSTFTNSNLMGAVFNNCNLSESCFQNINLQKSLIADLNLSGSEVAHVTLNGVTIHDTNLEGADEPVRFDRCDLSGSKLQNCNLKNVEISGSELAGMKINGMLVTDLLEVYTNVQGKS
ncbi:GNAT family N-acetyltransferase [Bacillus sp. AFS015802]|uniref:GNAT family N-acetyltransferase n=1 Tax=Bacillus sp. AFS015802 TaxID=2033486 RepID=UPI000BF5811A|nr:GNAT family N-acetyltransferase [Bacillus sp. AFS015802]PFA67668.1 GNAT family N-acetyltransferase [Bacillus sp. AFS015802]